MIDYLRLAQEYHGGRHDGFLTDAVASLAKQSPIPTKLSEDDFVKVRYDAKAMRWIANRPFPQEKLQKATHLSAFSTGRRLRLSALCVVLTRHSIRNCIDEHKAQTKITLTK